MIDFTIKTLDSNNHEFSVEDTTTVEQLKEQITTRMGIERHLQRLIFCGRVLQDEKPLSEYNVDGKVIHLVQRPPPSTNDAPPSTRRATFQRLTPATQPATNPGITDPGTQMRRLMTFAGPNASIYTEDQQMMSMSPTAGRLDMIRRKIAEIKDAIAALRAHLQGEEASGGDTTEAPADAMESEPAPAVNEDDTDQMDEAEDYNLDIATRAQNARRRYYTRAIRSMRARNSRPRDLGQLIEELHSLQQEFGTYRETYVRLLRDAGNAELPDYTDEERERNQRTVEHISDIMHSFAHAYHAISDINFRVGQRNPRLTSESTIVRLPTQAHINVVRRPRSYGSPYPTNIIASAQPDNAQSFEAQQNQINAAHSRNTTQPTVNINIEPDPITYQVEIETRVPIAFALENALMSMAQQQQQQTANQPTQMGQANSAGQSNQTDQPTQLGQNNLLGQTNQPGLANQPRQNLPGQSNQPGQHNSDSQPNQPNQPNAGNQPNVQGQGRRRQLFDFENMFRDLGNASGVEVVMSMEEIPSLPSLSLQGVAANLPNLVNINNLGNLGNIRHIDNLGVIGNRNGGNTGNPANASATGNAGATGNPVSASNIGNATITGNATNTGSPANAGNPGNAANVGNTGTTTQNAPAAAPQVQQRDGGVIVGPISGWAGAPSADLLQNIVSSVIRQGLVPGVESLMQAHMHLAGPGEPNVEAMNAVNALHSSHAAQAGAQSGDQANNTTGQAQPQTAPTHGTATGQRQPGLQLRRATTTTRAHAVTLSNLAYDRFLQCDSSHARRRIARRREIHQQHLAAQEAQRVARVNAQSINTIQNVYPGLTPELMNALTNLVDGCPTEEACLTALMLIIARYNAQSSMFRSTTMQPEFQPAEFLAVRYLMREYFYSTLATAFNARGTTMFSVVDMLVDNNTPFLNRISQITALKPDADMVAIFRSLIRSRLPAFVASFMLEPGDSDNLASRFYQLFSNLVTDLCALISVRCVDGTDGLRSIYWAFLNERSAEFSELGRRAMNLLAEANLTRIISNIQLPNSEEFPPQGSSSIEGIMTELGRHELIESNLQEIGTFFQERRIDPRYVYAAGRRPPANISPEPGVQRDPVPPVTPVTQAAEVITNPDDTRAPSIQSDTTESSEESLMEVSPETTQDEPMMTSNDDGQDDAPNDDNNDEANNDADQVDSEIPEPSAPEEESSSSVPSPTPSVSPRNQYSPEIVPSCHMRLSRSNMAAATRSTSADEANGTMEHSNDDEDSSSSTFSDPDLRISPPMLILEHWGEEWVPVFTRDRTSQRATQEPCSDAYMSGMPSRKRRCLRQSRPTATIEGLLGESVRDVTERPGMTENETMRLAMRMAFRERMRELAQRRANSSEDYSANNFSSADQFLNPDITSNTTEKSDSSSESRDME